MVEMTNVAIFCACTLMFFFTALVCTFIAAGIRGIWRYWFFKGGEY